ncbi:hypothetical protein AN6781.2 [Aspergillus nidulans FGSC A4]|uniref:Uncharacterized protein n=1 Tax=Emericella nidulans (strain FGSC A4 / ATCC 38163 / CBS 112.46 / NRRL 194 / M139) TaxID=227321 RepID=Q5AY49_EMENI|nr:hypothetical protein [Aspergillus nidulans FGSC A4]EAA58599.1 hypothetical protein AN6781.2 [Aspergillus nidulans FGSC A4]CBF71445.1 TPA: hypothetical protein ANIA_06781 [Aspergillus nidulans FGSC A4]|eukprot:XP_664385.1 hypothetical protein AN6781.2 [Aspergillus nidulans FGSC A4]
MCSDSKSALLLRLRTHQYPSMRYQVGRACAAAGYFDLYKELDLLPDVSIAEEAPGDGETYVRWKLEWRHALSEDATEDFASEEIDIEEDRCIGLEPGEPDVSHYNELNPQEAALLWYNLGDDIFRDTERIEQGYSGNDKVDKNGSQHTDDEVPTQGSGVELELRMDLTSSTAGANALNCEASEAQTISMGWIKGYRHGGLQACRGGHI